MIYANKKVNQIANSAQQTAQIISNVKKLTEKNLIRLAEDTVFLDPEIWKDKVSALNWINCLHLYYQMKRQFKKSDNLYFKDIVTEELIGSYTNKQAKVIVALK